VIGDLTKMTRRNIQNVNMMKNMHRPAVEGNFCDVHGNSLKPAEVQGYNRISGVVNTYSNAR
jgi:hypothetical protein